MTSGGNGPERERVTSAQRGRNIVVGLALVALVVLFFIMTIVRLGGSAPH